MTDSTLKQFLALEERKKLTYPRYDEVPTMWSYWRGEKGAGRALEEYYPGSLKHDEELRVLLYTWKATKDSRLEDRIHQIMYDRGEEWREKYREEFGLDGY